MTITSMKSSEGDAQIFLLRPARDHLEQTLLIWQVGPVLRLLILNCIEPGGLKSLTRVR